MDQEQEKELLKKYAALKMHIASLTDKLDEIKPEITGIVEKLNPIDKEVVVDGIGTFVIVQKRKYTYPQDITDLEAQVKEKKKEVEATGDAKFEIQPYLKFTSQVIE